MKAPTRAFLLLLAAGAATAQNPAKTAPPMAPVVSTRHKPKRVRPPQPPYNPNLIVLDPAHGGSDTGADLGGAGQEKDLNLAFANRLKALLEARQFTVVLTHASAGDDPTPDQRAETANRSRPVACLLLHSTNSGHGVYLFTSALTAPFFTGDPAQENAILPWDSAQASSLPRSLQLANELSTALNGLRVPLVVGRVSVRPIDTLTCAAVAVELAPAAADTSVADDAYQQHVAESIVTALSYWRDHARAQIAAAQAAALTANPPAPATPAKPKPKSRPRPTAVRDEPPAAPHKPAPIERKPPPTNPPHGGKR